MTKKKTRLDIVFEQLLGSDYKNEFKSMKRKKVKQINCIKCGDSFTPEDEFENCCDRCWYVKFAEWCDVNNNTYRHNGAGIWHEYDKNKPTGKTYATHELYLIYQQSKQKA